MTTAARPAATPLTRPDGTPVRILTVDDEASLTELLRAQGHEVRVVHDGWSALNEAIAAPPQVAFFDIGMPGLNGFEVCRRLRTAPWARSVPIVAITGLGQPSDRDRSRDAGFDAHWIKPIDPARLHALIAGLDRANDAVPPTASI